MNRTTQMINAILDLFKEEKIQPDEILSISTTLLAFFLKQNTIEFDNYKFVTDISKMLNNYGIILENPRITYYKEGKETVLVENQSSVIN